MVEAEKQGLYIVVEGIDGCGSSTQIDNLLPALEEMGLVYGSPDVICGTAIGDDIVTTREPGGTCEGEQLRYELLHDTSLKLTPQQELGKFTRQRMLLGRFVLEPMLADGRLVISERNWLSSYAYQGGGLELDKNLIYGVSQAVMGERLFVPDALVVIDVDPEIGFARMRQRQKDKIETRSFDFFERVVGSYRQYVEEFNGELIDGRGIEEEVARLLLASIRRQIGSAALDEYITWRQSLIID